MLLLGPSLVGQGLLLERGFLPCGGNVLQTGLQVLVFGQQAVNEIQRKRHGFVFALPCKPLHHQLVHEIQMVFLLDFGTVTLVGIAPRGHDVLPMFAALIYGLYQATLFQFVLFLQRAVMFVYVGKIHRQRGHVHTACHALRPHGMFHQLHLLAHQGIHARL